MKIWCFGIGTAVMWYFSWYAYRFRLLVLEVQRGQPGAGQDSPVDPAIGSMLIGAVILAIALTDHLIHVLFAGDHRIVRDLVDQSHGE